MVHRYLLGAALAAVLSIPVSAQFAPMPLYQHPAKGELDPYLNYPGCCAGMDCTPWPGEDLTLNPDGSYAIHSARRFDYPGTANGATIPAEKVHPSFNGQYHLCHTIIQGDPRNVDVYENGEARVFCLFVPQGM